LTRAETALGAALRVGEKEVERARDSPDNQKITKVAILKELRLSLRRKHLR
jgi:hypothetical protein